jgi:hypothetical protein
VCDIDSLWHFRWHWKGGRVCARDDASIAYAHGDTLVDGSNVVWVAVCLQVVACRPCVYYYWRGGG